MDWLHDLAYLFGGAFAANAIPHFVSVALRAQAYFKAHSPSRRAGLSSSSVNVLWGLQTSSSLICSSPGWGISIRTPPIKTSPWAWASF